MGFTVGSFHRAPIGEFEFSVFVITNHRDAAHNKWINRNFQRIAKDIGPKAVIVKGYNDDLSNEVKAFLERWMNDRRDDSSEAARAIWGLLDKTTCLLVAKKDIRTTDAPLLLIPLAPASKSDEPAAGSKADAENFIGELMQSVVEKVRDGTILEHAQALGAARFKLKSIRNGVVITTLRQMNDVMELKPNIAGFGMNLNALIEKTLGEARRA
jgi:hypothetical protein